MIGQERDLLRSVLVDPRDDLPRLVYADWMDENGQPDRAEFVRLQCRKNGGTKLFPPGSPVIFQMVSDPQPVMGLPKRIRAESISINTVFIADGIPNVSIGVRRGWPDEIHCTLAEFMGGGQPRHDCQQCRGRGFFLRPEQVDPPAKINWNLETMPEDLGYKMVQVTESTCTETEG